MRNRSADQRHNLRDHRREIEPVQHKRPLAGVGQHLAHQQSGALAGTDDFGDARLRRVGFGKVVHRQAGVAHDGRQQVVEIVRQTARQHAQTLQFLRLAHLLLEFRALRSVASDVRSSHHIAVRVVNGRDCQGDVNLPAVLAQAEGFEGFYPPTVADALDNTGLLMDSVGRHHQ